jgi:hypothetical protein
MKWSIAALISFTLAAHAAVAQPNAEVSQSAQMPSDHGIDLDQVFIRVKQEVGYFESMNPRTKQDWNALLTKLNLLGSKPPKPVMLLCGGGHIEFNVRKVRMVFAVAHDDSISGDGKFNVPLGPIKATVGGDFSSERTSTQEVGYTYYPAGIPAQPSDYAFLITNGAVIAPALESLRNSLIIASAQQPCFGRTPKTQSDSDADTYSFSIQLTDKVAAQAGFEFRILDANASAEQNREASGKIIVTISP